MNNLLLQSVFTYLSRIYANLLEQKKAFAEEKSSTPTGLGVANGKIRDSPRRRDPN